MPTNQLDLYRGGSRARSRPNQAREILTCLHARQGNSTSKVRHSYPGGKSSQAAWPEILDRCRSKKCLPKHSLNSSIIPDDHNVYTEGSLHIDTITIRNIICLTRVARPDKHSPRRPSRHQYCWRHRNPELQHYRHRRKNRPRPKVHCSTLTNWKAPSQA